MMMAAVEQGDVTTTERMLAMAEEVRRAVTLAIQYKRWNVVEIMLAYRVVVEQLGLDPVSLQSPLARHLDAVRLCVHGMQPQLKFHIVTVYRFAYVAVWLEEGTLPVGLSDLVCEYGACSRGLAQWCMQVQRQLRGWLKKLKRVGKLDLVRPSSQLLKRNLHEHTENDISSAKKPRSARSNNTESVTQQ
eukprot:TRINITY_DN12796_c0_g4_i1.p1 TRINITY_DN12796_c0_g4~~TRINITY_DN12796_c0_g4_i1.p1  ORF type:complete len:189 (+),score=28.45 TRINITY_DN12796_c0_g4_i1:1-567(+)